jgi:PAS domain S-box-containing protein
MKMSPFDLLTPESAALFKDRLEKLSRGEFINNIEEFQIVRKDGKKRWALITADYSVKNNTPIGATVVALDITSKKKKQQLIKNIFDSSPVALGTLDYANGKRIISEVNKHMCDMLGYSQEELVGKSAVFIYPSKEEFVRVGKIKYHSIFRGKRGTLETQWKRNNGEIIDVLLSTAPLDPKDPYAYSAFTALDITESKKRERVLNNELESRVDKWQEEYRIRVLEDTQLKMLDDIIHKAGN